MRAIRREDAPVAIQDNGVEFRKQSFGEMSVAFVQARKGTDLRPVLKGLPDDLCQCPHWGYVLKGRVRMHTRTGEQEYVAGQAFYWAPGHAPEVIEDAEYVDFSPTVELDEVIQHIKSQAQRG